MLLDSAVYPSHSCFAEGGAYPSQRCYKNYNFGQIRYTCILLLGREVLPTSQPSFEPSGKKLRSLMYSVFLVRALMLQ